MRQRDTSDRPLPAVFEHRRTSRVALEGTEPMAHPESAKGEGAPTMVALPLLFTTGHVDALSVVSDRPAAFSTVDATHVPAAFASRARRDAPLTRQGPGGEALDAISAAPPASASWAGESIWGHGQTLERCCGNLRPARLHPRLRPPAADASVTLLNEYFSIMGALSSPGPRRI